MIEDLNILDEKNLKILKQKSEEVTFPLSEDDLTTINNMIMYLRISQDEEYAEEHNLRAGMGLAAIQLGIPKRYFVVVNEYDEGQFETYVMINPRMISNSVEKIYVDQGEGCLSVNRAVDGIIPRYARVTFEAYDIEGRKINVRAREELAIAFQHELDHLNGMIFTDHIDPKNPFKDQEKMRAI